ncbi:MAG: acetate--CoA ligase [Saprospiraceae bacterium]|nr:acetate--CoA ligase [Saprospiraceae bacterium]
MTLQIKTLEEYHNAYRRSIESPEAFWAEQASTFYWRQPWHTVLKNDFITPDIQWFMGGKLNITENCLDRHIAERGDQTAILWEANDPGSPSVTYTYRQLLAAVNQCANALKERGIGKGDRVCFYMPMVPEVAIAMLACARIGAIHSVVFAGFSANALAELIKDSACRMVICSDFNARGSKNTPVKSVVDEAISLGCDSVESVLVLKTGEEKVAFNPALDIWWHDAVAHQPDTCTAEIMDAEDMLFILYTSGSTGKPKGVVHTCGGYMVYTCFSFRNVFQYRDGDVFWCTADVGWITGHSYSLYGPLLSGAITLFFEGTPTFPDSGRFWQVIEKHKVTQFYTAPTAIRALMASGHDEPDKYDLSSLKVIGSVGEPINEEAWHWYENKVGRGKAPIVDTWWQTETGGILITPLPHITDTKPCFASYPLPGVQPCLVDPAGNEIHENGIEGLLCLKFPWPSILRTTYGDHERCRLNYFAAFEGKYFTGDGCRRDEDGRYRIIGRVDDVINVSGHRIGTAEVENAINQHSVVVESAVVGYPHDIKGQGIYAYVITQHPVTDEEHFRNEVLMVVTKEIGAIAKPDKIQIVSGLPKTRSGKIMRRILRKIACGESDGLGDISTLLNPEIVDELKSGVLV